MAAWVLDIQLVTTSVVGGCLVRPSCLRLPSRKVRSDFRLVGFNLEKAEFKGSRDLFPLLRLIDSHGAWRPVRQPKPSDPNLGHVSLLVAPHGRTRGVLPISHGPGIATHQTPSLPRPDARVGRALPFRALVRLGPTWQRALPWMEAIPSHAV